MNPQLDANDTAPANNFKILEAGEGSDTVDLNVPTREIYVLADGDIKITSRGRQTDTIPGRVAGERIPIAATRIWATGTTADVMILW